MIGQSNHLEKHYVGLVEKSPLFFTAPHTKNLQRGGGKDYIESASIHLRQTFTAYLAWDFARNTITEKNSFLFWGKSNIINQKDIDPNYLLQKHFPIHPFHQSLHNWACKNQGLPILHVDIHGKTNRTYCCEVDIGILSMIEHWKGDLLPSKIRTFFEKQGNIFEGLKFGEFECKFNTNPGLHGFWGSEKHTMTEQAILLGIPSLQMEIPFDVRKRLFEDIDLRKKFYSVFNKLYQTVIVPDFKEKKRRYRVSREIGAKFKDTIKRKEVDSLYEELIALENYENVNSPEN